MRKALCTLLVVTILGGCGFQPMYGTDAENTSVTAALAAITINEIPDRLGQQVHNELLDVINPAGEPTNPAFSLSVRLVEEREDVGLRQDASVTRANYRLQAQFRLVDTTDESVLIDGSTWAETAFDVVSSDYSTLISERAAQSRLARDVALEIRNRLALYFGRDR